MELDDIERLLDLMDERDLEELEVEREGLHVRLRKRPRGGAAARPAPVPAEAPPAPPVAAAGDEAADEGLLVVKSPLVGTLHRAPEPGAPPFVEVGSAVRKGQVLCIIEAMKLMNEIDAQHDGEVVEVFAEDRQPVQYGAPLFAIKPR